MREFFPVTVENGRNLSYRFDKELRKYNLHRIDDFVYAGKITQRAAKKLEAFCRRNQLRFTIANALGTRSDDYRKTFFRNNKAPIQGHFFCAYCGKLVSVRYLTIDHLYPIYKASQSVRFQKKMRRKGINNINDAKNLVPACRTCNSKKGTKTGLWILRGKIGRIQWLWWYRWFIRIAIFFIALYWGYRLIFEHFL